MSHARYVDDPFDDVDRSIQGQNFWEEEFCEKIFDTIGRTRHQFKHDREISKWRRIDRALHTQTISKAWIEYRLEQAVMHHWSLETLMNAVLDTGKMDAWEAKQRPTQKLDVYVDEEEGDILVD